MGDGPSWGFLLLMGLIDGGPTRYFDPNGRSFAHSGRHLPGRAETAVRARRASLAPWPRPRE